MSLRDNLRAHGWMLDGHGKWRFLHAKCACGCEQVLALPERAAANCVQCNAAINAGSAR